jgi:membrane-bound lytic murein transglycosylase B
MGSGQRASPARHIASSLLAIALIVGLGAAAAHAFGRADLPMVTGRIPAIAYDAYRQASDAAPSIAPSCDVDWTILAGIGQVESRHGEPTRRHQITADGDVVPPIRGRALDGTGGTQPIPDTDGGELDGDATWDRAMGPMQFIPSTWRQLGRDGNGNGRADPDNLYDAALTAAAHLCLREPGDYTDRGVLRRALIGYNPSGRYADEVLSWIDRYRSRSPSDLIQPSARPST